MREMVSFKTNTEVNTGVLALHSKPACTRLFLSEETCMISDFERPGSCIKHDVRILSSASLFFFRRSASQCLYVIPASSRHCSFPFLCTKSPTHSLRTNSIYSSSWQVRVNISVSSKIVNWTKQSKLMPDASCGRIPHSFAMNRSRSVSWVQYGACIKWRSSWLK